MLPIKDEDVCEMYARYKSIQEIANELGCSRWTIEKRLKKNGVELRPPKTHCLSGKRFGKWTILGETENGHCQARCDCGKEKRLQAYSVLSGRTKQCSDCSYQSKQKGHRSIPGSYWNTLKAQAKNRNLDFTITIEDAWEIFERQQGCCALSGLKLSFDKSNKNASLDRIDSRLGYVENNIQWLEKTVNKLKSNLDERVFVEYCKRIAFHNSK